MSGGNRLGSSGVLSHQSDLLLLAAKHVFKTMRTLLCDQ